MAFKYKLVENKHAGTEDMFKDLLSKWDAEWKKNKEEFLELPQEIQDKIKNTIKKTLTEKKCWDGYEAVGKKTKDGKLVNDCKPIKK